jgi:hypothetical protein
MDRVAIDRRSAVNAPNLCHAPPLNA